MGPFTKDVRPNDGFSDPPSPPCPALSELVTPPLPPGVMSIWPLCYETLSLIHRILGKNKITEVVCLRAGKMFVQVNIILSIMRRDNGYFATNQSKVNISVLRKTFIISSIRLSQFVKQAAVVYVRMSCML